MKSAVTLPGVPSRSTSAAIPSGFVPGASTWKTKAPETGCASAEIARHVTVYVPLERRSSIVAATDFSSGREMSPESTRRAAES